MDDDDFKNEPLRPLDPVAEKEIERQWQAYLDSRPIDDVAPNRYTAIVLKLAEIIERNPNFKSENKIFGDFLVQFNKICLWQWKRLEKVYNLLRECEEHHAEDIALKFISLTTELLAVAATKQTSKANEARRRIGRSRCMDMWEYYEPILRDWDKKLVHIRLFQKQFDLFWAQHEPEILARSAAMKKGRKLKPNRRKRGKPNGKRPCELYPDHFTTFRVGFYRWRQRYEKNREAIEFQMKLESLIEQQRLMQS